MSWVDRLRELNEIDLNDLDLEEIVLDLMAVLENRQKHNAKAAA